MKVIGHVLQSVLQINANWRLFICGDDWKTFWMHINIISLSIMKIFRLSVRNTFNICIYNMCNLKLTKQNILHTYWAIPDFWKKKVLHYNIVHTVFSVWKHWFISLNWLQSFVCKVNWLFYIYNNASFTVILQLINWLGQLVSMGSSAQKLMVSYRDQFLS